MKDKDRVREEGLHIIGIVESSLEVQEAPILKDETVPVQREEHHVEQQCVCEEPGAVELSADFDLLMRLWESQSLL